MLKGSQCATNCGWTITCINIPRTVILDARTGRKHRELFERPLTYQLIKLITLDMPTIEENLDAEVVPTHFPLFETYQRVRRGVAKLGAAELKRLKIGPKQLGILYCLVEGRASTASELATITQSDRATISRCVNALTRGGLLTSRKHEDDRRWEILSLTPSGKRMAAKAYQARGRLEGVLTKSLNETERETLINLLAKVATSVDKNIQDENIQKESP